MRLNDPPAASPPQPIPLHALEREVPAVISRVLAGGEEVTRMQSMGICEGRPIHTVRTGSRMVVCAAGRRIGLDRKLAASVIVTPLPDGDGPPCLGATD